MLCLFISACCANKIAVNELQDTDKTTVSSIDTYTPPALVKGSCDQPLTNTTFLKAMDKLQLESLETAKLELAQKIIDHNCLTTSQINKILALFSFEKNKLNIAQSAYTSCYDPENYFIVARSLKQISSKDKLQEYIDGL